MGFRHSADEQLIERARDGDRVALQELWRAHRRWVAAIVLAHRPHVIEVEDLLQDVAVKFIDKLHTLRDAAAFRPWLRQIALNVCRGAARSSRSMLHLGRSQRENADGREAGVVSEPAGATGEVQFRAEQRDAANRLLEQALSLPMAYREPLLLRCLRSMTYQQISEVLQLPITTIETRLARARRMLRDELGDLNVPDQPKPAQHRARQR